MRILVACEESQAVTIELRKLGHEAYSCDIEPCSGGYPEWHLQQDVEPLLKQKWDMIIAFPPCTHLAASGAAFFKQKRADGRQQAAAEFFLKFTKVDCRRIAIENPIGVMSTYYRKPDQIIQPYEFGHPYTKKTCLWLKGLPHLIPTEILQKPETGWINQQIKNGVYGGYGGEWGGRHEDGTWRRYGDPKLKKIRSKTFAGIAQAMATQWAENLLQEEIVE